MDIKKARDLLQRYQSGDITSSEKKLVESWYQQLIDTGELDWDDTEKTEIRENLESALLKEIQPGEHNEGTLFAIARKWWVAASVILLIGILSGFFYFRGRYNSDEPIINSLTSKDIPAPQNNKAMIILSNGDKVFLDSISDGSILTQGTVRMIKLSGGKIAYQDKGLLDGDIQYNTLVNPRGSKIVNVVLADGTKVWLNANSRLTYPVRFPGNTREVLVAGEAYFEVAHDDLQQFIVHNGSIEIVVTGTHFNVNDFEDDDSNIRVTLLEGAVKVQTGNFKSDLKPGQQAGVHEGIKVINKVNLEGVMAWKNGYFQFDNASLKSVLKQVARWYDVDVIYEGKNRERQFTGEIERNLSLSEMLKILEMNKVFFTIEGKKIIVKSD